MWHVLITVILTVSISLRGWRAFFASRGGDKTTLRGDSHSQHHNYHHSAAAQQPPPQFWWSIFFNIPELSYLLLFVYFGFGCLWELAFTSALIVSAVFWSTGFDWEHATLRDLAVESDVHAFNLVLVLGELCINRPDFRPLTTSVGWWHLLTWLAVIWLCHFQCWVFDGRWRLDFLSPHRGWVSIVAYAGMAGVYTFVYLFGYWLHETALAAWVVTTVVFALVSFGVSVWVIDHDDAKRWYRQTLQGDEV